MAPNDMAQQLTIQQAMQLGMQHHQAGRLEQAQAIYRQVLALQPANADALNLLGVVAQQLGWNDEAISLMRRSVSANPRVAAYHSNLGVALERTGHLEESAACQRKAIELDERFLSAYSNLAMVLTKLGRTEEAIAWCRQALALKADFAPAHQAMGAALDKVGRLEESAAACCQAVRHAPRNPEAHNGLAVTLGKLGRYDEALAACRRAIELAPAFAAAHNTLGNILREQGKLEDAVAAHQAAIRLRRAYPEAHYNLGVALQKLDRWEEAIEAYEAAIALNGRVVDAHLGVGTASHSLGQSARAIAAYREALRRDDQCADAHWGLALELLASGQFTEGWQEYEWRWRCRQFAADQRHFAAPLWDGSDLSGRTILLHMEQGLGDAIQFARYVPLLAARGARVILQCDRTLVRLLATVPGVEQVVADTDPLPPFDVHCPLLSLPGRVGTALETIPAQVPYLSRPHDEIDVWRRRLPADASPQLKVGLAWAGNPTHINDRHRSCRLADLSPLGDVPGVLFVDLQKGPAAQQAHDLGAPLHLCDLTADLRDLADTAALLANLDLVICVDTAVAHLAGAMARDVWLLLPAVPDWRWMRNRSNSPWYPTMRLFRQSRLDDWATVVRELATELQRRAASGSER